MNLIDRDALHKIYYGWLSQLDEEKEAGQLEAIQTCLSVLEDAPEVDANPVVHGEWRMQKHDIYTTCACSRCGTEFEWSLMTYDFCPNCGAKMVGRTK